jgi:hypothetical protein
MMISRTEGPARVRRGPVSKARGLPCASARLGPAEGRPAEAKLARRPGPAARPGCPARWESLAARPGGSQLARRPGSSARPIGPARRPGPAARPGWSHWPVRIAARAAAFNLASGCVASTGMPVARRRPGRGSLSLPGSLAARPGPAGARLARPGPEPRPGCQ